MRRSLVLLCAGLTMLSAGAASAENATPHNLILFVPDGLRALKVTPETAPAMAAIRDKGVNFKNPHSLFPTFTMANGSAIATGHYLGDTGDLLQHDLHRLHRPPPPATPWCPFSRTMPCSAMSTNTSTATISTKRPC